MENIEPNLINSNIPVKPEVISSPVKFSKLQIALAGLCAILILSAVAVVSLKKPATQTPFVLQPLPSATQSASLIPRVVSEFGKSEGFLIFENNLTNLQKLNDTIDLYESKMTFPLLDMKVNFDKN